MLGKYESWRLRLYQPWQPRLVSRMTDFGARIWNYRMSRPVGQSAGAMSSMVSSNTLIMRLGLSALSSSQVRKNAT